MKQNIYKMLLAIAVIAIAQLSHAQSPYTLKQVIVLNQGPYGNNQVTVGSYDPSTKTYQRFDSMPGLNFSTQVIIDSGFIYVAADTALIKYDLNTRQKVASQGVRGIREMAVWHNQLLVTRGDVSVLNSYFQAYDKNTLNLIYQLTSVSAATEGIKVLNDTAYIAINNFGSGTIGKLGIIDLKNETENREIDLGATGKNPYDVEVEASSNSVYTVNALSYYDSTSISRYITKAGTFTNKTVNVSSSCNSSTYYLGNLFYQTSADTNVINLANSSSLNIWDSLKIHKASSCMTPDSLHGYMYVGNTNFISYGKVLVYDLYSHPVDSFLAGSMPASIALDVRSSSGINGVLSAENLQLYPNPVTSQLKVLLYDTKDAVATLTLTDILGREVYKQQISTNASHVVPMSSLTQGVYFLTVKTTGGELTRKIVKE